MSKNQDIWKEKLEQGFAELTPDCWEELRSAIPQAEQSIISSAAEETERKSAFRRFIPAIAAAAAVLICFFSFTIRENKAIESMIYLDVNPSICVNLNSKGDVVSVEGLNDDGRKTADAALEEIGKSKDLDETVRCIIAVMDREGYFSDGEVDALVSLCYVHEEDSSRLEHVCGAIEEYAASRKLTTHLLSQSFARDTADEEAASQMGISPGKYKFIVRLAKEVSDGQDKVTEWAAKPAREIIRISDGEEDEADPAKTPDDKSDNAKTEEETEDQTEDEVSGETAENDDSSVTNGNSSKEKDSKDNKTKKSNKKAKKNKNKEKKNSNSGKGNKKGKKG